MGDMPAAKMDHLWEHARLAWGVDLPPGAPDRLIRFLELLLHWNRRTRLTGHRDRETAALDLLLDSLALVTHVQGPRLLDIGSGPGIPGLVLALAIPDLEVTLVDATAKKVSFQRQAIRDLDLSARVTSLHGRAGEDCDPGRDFDTVTLRAVGELAWSLDLGKKFASGCGGEGGAADSTPPAAGQGVVLLPRGVADREEALSLGLGVEEYFLPGVPKARCIVMLRC